MPSDDWATRHPELVHWLHQAEDELVGYAPMDEMLTPATVFPVRLLPFFVAIEPSVPRSRGLSEHGVFSCEECCIPAHMQG